MEMEPIIMVKNVFRKRFSSLSLWKHEINNPALSQKCQVLQLFCGLRSLFPVNGAGPTPFSHGWSYSHHTTKVGK